MESAGHDYDQLIQAVADPMMLVDADHKILAINDAVLQATGMDREQLIGSSCNRIFHGADVPPDDCPLEAMRLTGRPVARDMEIQPFDCWFRTSVWMLPGAEGSRKVLHLGQDVTERVAAEAALAAHEKRLRNLFEDSPEAMFCIAASGELLEVNRAGRELLGSDPGEGDDGNMPDWDAARGFGAWEELMGELRGLGFIKDREVSLLGGDGVTRTVLLTAHLAQDEVEGAIRVQAIVKDVSVQKRLEAMMLQAMKMDGLGRLAGGIAHGFNNALTAIRGYADLTAASLAGNSDAFEYLAGLQQAVDKASGLSRQLLVFSSSEGVEARTVHLGDLIVEKASELSRGTDNRYLIETAVEPDLWPVEADAALLGQVLTIILENARDAMPDGGRIQVGAVNASPDQPVQGSVIKQKAVCITVRDEGEGIPPDNLERIFDPFFSTRTVSSSDGMGLAIAHSIVRQHGGWIDVESAPDKGTVFNICLPRIHAAGDETAAEPRQPAVRTGGRKILLVEDEPGVRGVAITWLSRNGYDVFAASDAREARVIFEREQGDFDIVFSDLVMPGESGLNLVLSLLGQKPDLGAVIASGYGGEDARQAEIEARGIRFVQKPYALVELLEELDRLLDQ